MAGKCSERDRKIFEEMLKSKPQPRQPEVKPKGLIEGSPENLEGLFPELHNYSSLINICEDDLKRNIVGFTKDEERVISLYFYFPLSNAFCFTLSHSDQSHPRLGLGLKMENYGFPDDKRVRIAPERLELELSDRAREVYERLLGSQEVHLNDLLESVGFVVNDSMEYDFNKIINTKTEHYKSSRENGEMTESDKKTIRLYEEGLRSKGYIPTGREVIKGICLDSGDLIRKILRSMNLENEFGGMHTSAFSYYFPNGSNDMVVYGPHDTTTVFSKKTGRWSIINSKSPIKPYNLVPKEKIGVDFTFERL